MDRFGRAHQLRDDYESSLDEAEKLRARYHREVLKLHRSGLSLREIAEQLGISHQRVHQIVGVAEEPRRRGRMIGGAAGVIVVLGGLILGWVAFHDGSPSVRASPRPSIETQAPVRTTLCTSAAGSRDAATVSPISMARMATLCAVPGVPGVSVVMDPRSGNILALSYEHPIVSIGGTRRLQDALESLRQLEGLRQDDWPPSDRSSL